MASNILKNEIDACCELLRFILLTNSLLSRLPCCSFANNNIRRIGYSC